MLFITLAAIGAQEILIIVLVLVLLFGARKIPELMKGVGQGIREFKEAKDGSKEKEIRKNDNPEP